MDSRMLEKLAVDGVLFGAACLGSLAFAQLLNVEPSQKSALISSVIGLLVVIIRGAFEYWKIRREDRGKIKGYRARLRALGVDPDKVDVD